MAMPSATDEGVAVLCALYLRPVDHWDDVSGWVFVPPLTAAEQASYADLQTMAKFSVNMTLAEWQSVKADAANLKAYYGLASPTNAQSVAAIKSVIHILSVIVRS